MSTRRRPSAHLLVAAAESGRLEVVKLLLAAGADVHAKRTDRVASGLGEPTALTEACMDKTSGHQNIVKELLAAGTGRRWTT